MNTIDMAYMPRDLNHLITWNNLYSIHTIHALIFFICWYEWMTPLSGIRWLSDGTWRTFSRWWTDIRWTSNMAVMRMLWLSSDFCARWIRGLRYTTRWSEMCRWGLAKGTRASQDKSLTMTSSSYTASSWANYKTINK